MGTQKDFLTKVNDKYYETHEGEFTDDHVAWLVSEGVPEKYARKVASVAWDHNHSYGFYEVVNASYDLIDIFKE